jgi:hypothetical protein
MPLQRCAAAQPAVSRGPSGSRERIGFPHFLVLLLLVCAALSVRVAADEGVGGAGAGVDEEEEWAFVKQCKHGKFLLNKHDTDISKVLAETGE